MISQTVTITNPTGLQLKAAGVFCEIAVQYKCRATFVANQNYEANCKSVLSVLGACLKLGDKIELSCDGEDEEKCLEHLVKTIEDGFSEGV